MPRTTRLGASSGESLADVLLPSELHDYNNDMANNVSSISQALNGTSGAIDIPLPAGAVSSYTLVPSSGYDAKYGNRVTGLPTPPNSISPNLPPQAFRAKLAKEMAGSPPLSQIDSDIDLQEEADTVGSLGNGADDGIAEGVGDITPAVLAKNHLPQIVLEKGPMAIRTIMNDLAETLPGFKDIAPAKARRIVVAGLESRGGGGPNGDVEFEKVGWGRWDARPKGYPSRSDRPMFSIAEGAMAAPASSNPYHQPTPALRIPGSGGHRHKSRRLSHGSFTGESSSSRSDRGDRHDGVPEEYEIDRMSIDDEDEQRGRRKRIDTRLAFRDQAGSETDEEDWASIGVTALRLSYGGRTVLTASKSRSRSGARARTSFSQYPQSLPIHKGFHTHYQRNKQFDPSKLDFTGVDADSQEREAIEALLRMGSM